MLFIISFLTNVLKFCDVVLFVMFVIKCRC